MAALMGMFYYYKTTKIGDSMVELELHGGQEIEEAERQVCVQR